MYVPPPKEGEEEEDEEEEGEGEAENAVGDKECFSDNLEEKLEEGVSLIHKSFFHIRAHTCVYTARMYIHTYVVLCSSSSPFSNPEGVCMCMGISCSISTAVTVCATGAHSTCTMILRIPI